MYYKFTLALEANYKKGFGLYCTVTTLLVLCIVKLTRNKIFCVRVVRAFCKMNQILYWLNYIKHMLKYSVAYLEKEHT